MSGQYATVEAIIRIRMTFAISMGLKLSKVSFSNIYTRYTVLVSTVLDRLPPRVVFAAGRQEGRWVRLSLFSLGRLWW